MTAEPRDVSVIVGIDFGPDYQADPCKVDVLAVPLEVSDDQVRHAVDSYTERQYEAGKLRGSNVVGWRDLCLANAGGRPG